MKLKFLFLFLCASVMGWGQCTVSFTTSGTGTAQNCPEADPQMSFTASGQFVYTSIINNPTSVSFNTKRSSNTTSWSLLVQISPEGGAINSWTTVATITSVSQNCPGTPQSVDFSAYTGERRIRFIDNRASGNHERAINSIVINCQTGNTVTFKANGGIGADYTQTESEATDLIPSTFIRTGYTFEHWNNLSDGTGTISFNNEEEYDFSADLDLYAQWQINQYTVSFDGNGNDGGTVPSSITNDYNFTFSLPNNTSGLTKTGFAFNGWNTNATGTGTHYNVGSNYTIPANNVTLFAEWVSTTPVINTTGSITAMDTTYGTTSTTRNFSFNGLNLTGTEVIVTAPSGFEVATTSGGSYSNTITYAINSGSSSGTVYVRLAATTPVGTYNGNINLSAGSTSATIAIPNSTVSPKNLTITGLNLTGNNKVYNGNISATVGGSASLSGVISGDNVVLGGTPTFTYNNKNVGNNKPITVSGYTISGTDAGNYSLSQPTWISGNITAAILTVTGAVAQDKVWDGNNTATIIGATLVGVISPDVVSVSGGGTFAQTNAGTNINVTANLNLGGADAGNYTLSQPTGLTANITKANLSFTTATINISIGGTYTLPGANITSPSDGVFSYSITGGGNATYDGVNTLNGVSVGTETLTINQAEGTNHLAGSATVTVNVTSTNYVNGDYRSASTGLWNPDVTQTSAHAKWDQYNSGSWTLNVSPPARNTSNKLYIQNGHVITSGTSYGNNVKIYVQDGGKFVHEHSSTAHTVYIYKGGTFEFGNQALTISTLFEIEDEGNFIYNYTANYGSGINLWNGTEVFHPNSNFIIKAANTGSGGYFMPADTRITQFPGTNGYFGNLIFDQTSADVRITTSNFNNKQITNGNLEFRPPSSGTHNLFYGSVTWTIGKDLIIGTNSNSSAIAGNVNLTTGSNNITFNVKGNFINNSKNVFRLSNSTSGSNTNILNIDGNMELGGTSTFNLRFGTAGTAIVNLKGDLFIGSNAFIQGPNAGSTFNFAGTGDGLTPETTQTIDVVNQSTASNITFNTNNGSYVKLARDFNIGTSSIFNILGTNTSTFGTFDASTYTLSGTSSNPLTVNSYGRFKTANPLGFSGASSTSVGDQIAITLQPNSTVEYYADGNQTITKGSLTSPTDAHYQNLLITGSGIKTTAHGDVIVNGMTSIKSANASLRVPRPGNIPDLDPIPLGTTPNVFYALGGIDNTIGTTGQFILSSDANLIQHTSTRNDADNTHAKITVERFVQDMDANYPTETNPLWDYVYWSSPVENHPLRSFSPGTNPNRFYEYRESNNLFYNAPENEFFNAKGYAIRAEEGLGITYQKTYKFEGKPNNASSISSPLLLKANNGYNLVGNPFPSNIDLDELFEDNSTHIHSIAYFWTNNTPTYYQSGANYVSNSYAIYNGTGGVPATTNANPNPESNFNITATPNGFAKVGQGFIVKAKTDNQAPLIFNHDIRKPNNDTFFQKGSKNRFWISLTSPAQMVNTLLIGYIPGATNEFDNDFDASLMTVGSDAIYSILGNKKLAIQGRNSDFQNTDVIPLGVKIFENGRYKIDLTLFEGLFEDQDIYLSDKYSRIIHDLKAGPYSFRTASGIYSDRFEIIFKRRFISVLSQLSLTSTSNKLTINKENSHVLIKSTEEKIKEVIIYNLIGKPIYENKTVHTTRLAIPESNFEKQIIIVTVETETGEKISKKLLID
jgi:uncharacterized repeat protein (TIGR02543 family)